MRYTCRMCSFMFVFVLLLSFSTPISARIADSISIHGFGGWAYGKTDNENLYLMGNEDGNYSHLDFSLNISAGLHENLRLYVQPGWDERQGGNEIKIDYAFAEWFISDLLSFRIGKVKAPFMLYTEIYSVGTVRPFFSLAQGIYKDLAAEGYKGLGLTGITDIGDWEIQYDLYSGKLELLPVVELDLEQFALVNSYPQLSDVIGGRVMARPPIEGVSFGISSYTGDNEMERDGVVVGDHVLNGRYLFMGLSLEYLADVFEMRVEYLREMKDNNFFDTFHTAYSEIAYTFKEHWQIAVRYEFVDFDTLDESAETTPDTLYEHSDLTVGLNYWFSHNFAVKVAHHYVKGNHLSYPGQPEQYAENLLTNDFVEATNLIVIGTQFSF